MRNSTRVVVLLLAAIAARPHVVAAQRSVTEYSTPVARNATPTTAESLTIPRAPAPLSDAQRISIVRSAELDVGGIEKHLRLTPRQPYTSVGHLKIYGTSSPVSPATDGAFWFPPIGAGHFVNVRFRVMHADRPVLVDFVSNSPSPGAAIVLKGSGIFEKRVLSKGDHHVTAVIVPKGSGWYEIRLTLAGSTKSLYVYAVEVTVLN